jgi:glycosyltransferase involved in cell wall biosynthesis
VIAADVGSLKEEIVEGKTGFAVEPKNPKALAQAIRRYFQSDLYQELESRRFEIQDLAAVKYSWTKVAEITIQTYANLLREEKNDATFSLNSHSSLQR